MPNAIKFRLKAFFVRLTNFNENFSSDVPHAGSSTPVNLTKRCSNNTPVRTVQLAFEDEDELVIDQGTQSPSQKDSRSETNKPQTGRPFFLADLVTF